MAGKLVTLMQVDTYLEAELTVSMLKGYGIYAASEHKGQPATYFIKIVDTDLDDAKALLAAIEEENRD